MTARGVDGRLLEESAEDLYENAPCGYLSTDPDGLIVKVNGTFLAWTGYSREELVGRRRFQELLNAGGRIYHETHYAPLLRMQGTIREIALEIVRSDGSLLPALVNSVLVNDRRARPQVIRTTIFDATDRRRYEEELLSARVREREIAVELQRSLLAGEQPADPRLQIAIEYRAGGAGLEVGGDWYDAFPLSDGAVALVVGDVVGRGIAAAATMGQIRSAVRALASTGLRPGALLDALDRFARRHDVGLSTTLVYAELALDDGTLRWACAGHPPPLILRGDGEARLAWEGRSAPLDAYVDDPPRRAEGSVTLGRGDSVLLYTDGLVERRDMTLDAGLERLTQTVRRERDESVRALVTRVFESMAEDVRHSDDVCVLAARLTRSSGSSGPPRPRGA